jgi:hypothetical protein
VSNKEDSERKNKIQILKTPFPFKGAGQLKTWKIVQCLNVEYEEIFDDIIREEPYAGILHKSIDH